MRTAAVLKHAPLSTNVPSGRHFRPAPTAAGPVRCTGPRNSAATARRAAAVSLQPRLLTPSGTAVAVCARRTISDIPSTSRPAWHINGAATVCVGQDANNSFSSFASSSHRVLPINTAPYMETHPIDGLKGVVVAVVIRHTTLLLAASVTIMPSISADASQASASVAYRSPSKAQPTSTLGPPGLIDAPTSFSAAATGSQLPPETIKPSLSP